MENIKYFTEKFHISEARYVMLFSYDNVYGIFRPKNRNCSSCDSREYDLYCFQVYENDAPDDVLKDILFLTRSGKLILHFNDVVCIKLNGFVASYRYCGDAGGQETNLSRFVQISEFLNKEKDAYIKAIHREKMVLSVLEGRLYYLAAFVMETYKAYCIEEESYGPILQSGNVITNYSLYMLRGNSIQNINPHSRPFVMLKNALYFFYKKRKKNNKSMLLFNKQELEIIKDYMELQNVELVI